MTDALNAVRALLHHSTVPDGHIRITHHLVCLRLCVGVLQKVEPADLVRTIVQTIPGTDAAVVRHHVQTLRVMRCCRDRTYNFTRGVFTMHACHGLCVNLWIIQASLIISIDANPVHLTSAVHLLLSD